MISTPSRTLPPLAAAWVQLVREYPATHAVTLSYNPHLRGSTASPCYRVDQYGECHKYRSRTSVAVDRVPDARVIPVDRVQRDLNVLHARVDRQMYGTQYHRLPADKRSSFVGFIEKLTENTHIHLAWRVTSAPGTYKYCEAASRTWSQLASSGTIVVRPVVDAGWAEYITKTVASQIERTGDAALCLISHCQLGSAEA